MPEIDSEPLPTKDKKTTSRVKKEPTPEALTAKSKRPRSLTSNELAFLLKRPSMTTYRRA